MSLLSSPALLIATANLAVQLIIMGLLIYGYWLKSHVKLRQHGFAMSAALILHLATIFSVMIPSFVLAVIPYYVLQNPLELASVVGLIHGFLGATAAVMGIWLVVSWHFQKNVQGCYQRKKFMVWTLGVWASALLFGILLYSILVGPFLVG